MSLATVVTMGYVLADVASVVLMGYSNGAEPPPPPPVEQPTQRGGRAWWGWESFDGSRRPWWYKDLKDKAKALELLREERIARGILSREESRKLKKVIKQTESFAEEIPLETTYSADRYLARYEAIAAKIEAAIDEFVEAEDEEAVIATVLRILH